MKIKNLILLPVAIFQFYILKIWLTCKTLQDSFQFSPFDAHLKTDNAILNDTGYSTLLVRYFHNKIIVYSTEFFNRYFHFWDPNFALLIFTLVGFFGILYGFYYESTKPKKSKKLLYVIFGLLLLPIIEVVRNPLPFTFKIIILTVPFYLWSLYGLYTFNIRHKKWGVRLICVLLAISIWYFFVFQKDIFTQFCYNK